MISSPFHLEKLPEDPIFGIDQAFKKDPRTDKANLVVGAYRDEEGQAWELPSVAQAVKELGTPSRGYLPIEGDQQFIEGVRKLFFDAPMVFQTLGGAGALTLGGELIKRGIKDPHLYLPDPTWANHVPLFQKTGIPTTSYPYPDHMGMIKKISTLKENEIFLLHLVCHNPTGIDPTPQEWEEIAEAFSKGKGLPFFDLAYLGFGEGVKEDLQPLALFIQRKIPFLVAFSCSKSFGLYNERVGALIYSVEDEALFSQGKKIIRNTYSNPPAYGARIVAHILQDKKLYQQWEKDLETMRHHIAEVRDQFFEGIKLPSIGKGMFTLLPLKEGAADKLREEKAIYLPTSGRISFAGINSHNCDQVVHAIRPFLK